VPLVDRSCFQLGVAPGEDPSEEGPLLAEMEVEARSYVESRRGSPPIAELLLAFGVGGIVAVYLVSFDGPLTGELAGETEVWAVVGDLPSAVFETIGAETPKLALRLYCAICEDWAEAVLTGRDLSESYPMAAAPTVEHAEMLRSRIAFLKQEIMPMAAG